MCSNPSSGSKVHLNIRDQFDHDHAYESESAAAHPVRASRDLSCQKSIQEATESPKPEKAQNENFISCLML